MDQRWIYYETEHKCLNRARPEFGANLEHNEFLITVPEPRKVSETRPLYATTLVNLHVHERGSVVIPRETRGDDLLVDRDANLPEAAWRVLCDHFGLTGHRRDDDARHLTGNCSALPWRFSTRRPIRPITGAPCLRTGRISRCPKMQVHWSRWQSPVSWSGIFSMQTREARDDVFAVLNEGRSAQLGQLHKLDGSPVRTEDLLVTVNYWGGAKGPLDTAAVRQQRRAAPGMGRAHR